jgi:uncharacterized YccA/Bax inhibitor family protein
MDLGGTVNKSGILLLICMATAAWAWSAPAMQGGLLYGALFGAFIISLVAIFKPATSPYLAPLYAALEGLVLGAISLMFNQRFPGIVVNACLLTFSVLGLFLFLYATRVVKVTRGMKVAILSATLSICVVYGIDILLGFFGVHVPFIHSSGWLGIGLSVAICGVAAFNLFLDFDMIETRIRDGSPKYMEWYCGMALLITLVWLYLEILRLLAKLQSRR